MNIYIKRTLAQPYRTLTFEGAERGYDLAHGETWARCKCGQMNAEQGGGEKGDRGFSVSTVHSDSSAQTATKR